MSDKVKSRLMIAGAAFCAALFLFSGAKVYVKQEVFGAIGTARTGFLHAADNADHLLLAVLVTVPHDNMHPSI